MTKTITTIITMCAAILSITAQPTLSATQRSKLGVVWTNKDHAQVYTQANPSPFYNEEVLALTGVQWWYDYRFDVPSTPNFSGQADRKLFGYWQLTAAKTAASITAEATAAKTSAYGQSGPVYWYLANEPNNRGQGFSTPQDYALLFKKYRDAILAGDPTAKIVGPGLVWWDAAHYFPDWPGGILDWFHNTAGHYFGLEWYEAFRTEYHSLYGEYPQVDVFNHHLYDFGSFLTDGLDQDAVMAELTDIITDIQAWPELAGKPIWITEIGIPNFSGLWATNMTNSKRVKFMAEILDQVTNVPQVERVFWFMGHPDKDALDWEPTSSLMNRQVELNQLGIQFRGLALGHIPIGTTANTTDSNPGDGICDTGNGFCSLRAAIQEANASTGMDTIGFYFPVSHASYSDPDAVAGTGDEYYRIPVATPLPALQQPLFINGLLQPGSACGGTTISTTLPGGPGRKIKDVQILLDFSGVADGQPAFQSSSPDVSLWLQGLHVQNSPTRKLLTEGTVRLGCSYFWTSN